MRAASPVIIVSPAMRAGTTLVQRLLCSAPNTLVFGDTIGQEMEFFAKYAAVKAQTLAFQEVTGIGQKQAVLAGDTSDFIAQLSVSAAAHVEGLRAAAMAWMQVCVDEAAAAGRPVWGWKTAGTDASALPLLAQWLPQARWIWVQRDVVDCYRSAKAAGMVRGVEDARRFVQQSEAAVAAFAALGSGETHRPHPSPLPNLAIDVAVCSAGEGARLAVCDEGSANRPPLPPRVSQRPRQPSGEGWGEGNLDPSQHPRALILNYKAMLADPSGTIRRLEAWTGAVGIDPTVFSVRVNQPGQAIATPPADLDAEEQAVFAAQAPERTFFPALAA